VKKLVSYIFLSLLIFWVLSATAQNRFLEIEKQLDALAINNKGYNQKVELSVTNVSLQEFLTGIAVTNNLNISVDPNIKISIVNNFSNVTVKEVLLFIIKKYDLDVNIMGSIVSIIPYKQPVEQPKPAEPKTLGVFYDKTNNQLSLDLKNDSLYEVIKEIVKVSGKNIILSPGLNVKIVNSYIQKTEFEKAIDLLAFANELKVTKLDNDLYQLEKKDDIIESSTNKPNSKSTNKSTTQNSGIDLKTNSNLITLSAFNVPILEIINTVSSNLKKNYFLFSEPKGLATLVISNASYDQFLYYLLNGTEHTFKIENDIYLIGDRNLEGLRATKVIQLQNRTIDKVIEFIPAELKKGIELKAFAELNSFIASGSLPKINELEVFIRDIDRVVPVIMIEVILVDVKKSKTISTGIKAGIGDESGKTGGSIAPGVNFDLNASSVNNLINTFNGFGLFNLGRVTPNFYLSLKALEEQGILNTRSTPKLATINGHEAKMSIGKTEYYLEIQNNVIGTQNPQNIISQQYKSVNADLSLIINPIVSGDDYITLDIKVEQSDFTARISPNAPPGSVKRNFQSLIRVKNEEMIILGGLEEEGARETGSGLPLLARIPVIKWIFGNRTKETNKTRLNVFIKPTIIY
jgi:type IV pilus assembly protein PilQ